MRRSPLAVSAALALVMPAVGAAHVRNGRLVIQRGQGVAATGNPSRLAFLRPDGTGEHAIGLGLWASWTADGRRLVYDRTCDACDGQARLKPTVARANAKPIRAFRLATTSPPSIGGEFLAVSPDGSHVAYVRDSPGRPLEVAPITGRRERQLHRGRADDRFGGMGPPSWSPDSRRIASADDEGRLWVFDARGRRARIILRTGAAGGTAWSPDGRTIAFCGYGHTALGDVATIYLIHADGHGLRRVGPGSAPFWSPDGRHLGFIGPGAPYPTTDGLPPAPPPDTELDIGDARGRHARTIAHDVSGAAWQPLR